MSYGRQARKNPVSGSFRSKEALSEFILQSSPRPSRSTHCEEKLWLSGTRVSRRSTWLLLGGLLVAAALCVSLLPFAQWVQFFRAWVQDGLRA
jgi:hypothetical protein